VIVLAVVFSLLLSPLPSTAVEEPTDTPTPTITPVWVTPTPFVVDPNDLAVDFDIGQVTKDQLENFPMEMVGAYNRVDDSSNVFTVFQGIIVMMIIIGGGLSIVRQLQKL
jgi:hypothetical protein